MAAACIVFADIVGFSTKRSSLQREIIDSFNKELRGFLIQFIDPFTGDSEVIALPTGDGACLSFLLDKEDRKWNASTIFDICIRLHKWAFQTSTPENSVQLRMGVHMGIVDIVLDLNNKKNVVGDTINFASRVMSAAKSCQTLISDTVFNEYVGVATKSLNVESGGKEYRVLFSKPLKSFAKHERELTAYEMQLDPNEDFLMGDLAAPVARVRKDFEPEMITVEGGTFNMGNKEGNTTEKPVHAVELTGFQISKYVVTQKLWRAVMGNNPSKNKDKDNHPVERVSMTDIQDFLRKMNEMTGGQYRLPTEAEWEYAARGGQHSKGYVYSGGNDLKMVAWDSENSKGTTQSVGQKQPNELGICDMSGNVWEWCNDWYEERYYANSPAKDPQGPAQGDNHVIRGGSWINFPAHYRVSDRYFNHPNDRRTYLGFRLVCPLD
jgi:formylglycine-generating enzyme required for sulfatase activity